MTNNGKYVLGISCFYHDSAAVLIKNGQLVAAAQEERFTRKKHDESFPSNAIKFCLSYEGITINDISYIGFYDKPLLKFERIVESFIKSWPQDYKMFIRAMPIWLKDKLWVKNKIKKELNYKGPIYFSEHHMSHAASAFFVSPFRESAILTVDGVGEWATTSLGRGRDNNIQLLKQIDYPDSLGLFYSLFTYYLGFKPNSGEYKVMGLAPYGKPRYAEALKKIIKIYDDGSFRLDRRFFKSFYSIGNVKKLENLFKVKKRNPTEPLENFHKDLAVSLQVVTNEIMVRLANFAKMETKLENLCLSGGVALNCVANSEILKRCGFKNIYIQPAAGDAGGALGAAFYVWNQVLGNKRDFEMTHVFWGPSYSNDEIGNFLKTKAVEYELLSDEDIIKRTAKLIANQNVVGWFNGRMEWGPRALGNRSILADPRNKENWQRVNLKIKFRESFRPFAPSVLREDSSSYFDLNDSSYMLFIADVKSDQIPAVTHVDKTARIQTVNHELSPEYYNLIKEFKSITGCPILINTSFNIRGEPIVCSPEDAFNTFIKTDMDYLVLENFILDKKKIAVKYPFIKPNISHDAD